MNLQRLTAIWASTCQFMSQDIERQTKLIQSQLEKLRSACKHYTHSRQPHYYLQLVSRLSPRSTISSSFCHTLQLIKISPFFSLPMSNNTSAPAPAASSSTSVASRANYDNQGGGTGGSSNSASSSWRMNITSHTFSHDNKDKLEESDDDMFTVPDVEAPQLPAQLGDMTDSNIITKNNNNNNNTTSTNNNNKDQQTSGKRRRGRNPVDREHRRLKRLLRNRVSAQQARERKKVYVSDLESRATELQDRNSKLEEKISTLMNENTMLRKVLLNTRPKADESNEPNP